MNKKLIKLCYLTLLSLLWGFSGFAQKKPLDHSSWSDWPAIKNTKISNDGRFIAYILSSSKQDDNLIVQATGYAWRKNIPVLKGFEGSFVADNRHLVFPKSTDTLGIMELPEGTLRYIGQMESYKMAAGVDNPWLAYRLKDSAKSLVLVNLQTKIEQTYKGVESYTFNKKGDILVIQQSARPEINMVRWLDLKNNEISYVGHGFIKELQFNEAGNELALLMHNNAEDIKTSSIWYYNPGLDSAKVLVDASNPGMQGMAISGGLSFSKKGDQLFFSIKRPTDQIDKKANQTLPQLDVWSCHDDAAILQYGNGNGPFIATLQLDSDRTVIRLQQREDGATWLSTNGNYILFKSNAFNELESGWRSTARPDLFLVSTRDGRRMLIKKRLMGYCGGFSVSSKYVIWYDAKTRQWFTYNIAHKITKNITQGIKGQFYYEKDHPSLPSPYDIGGWLENDTAVLIYDRFDIWEVDPDGIKPPVNITQGFGHRNNIQLRLLNFNNSGLLTVNTKDTLLLSAFNMHTKESGFFKLTLNPANTIRKLVMGAKIYYFPFPYGNCDFLGFDNLFFPLKAKSANTWVLRPMSPTLYPNLSITTDFTHFKSMTDLAPNKAYNWYNSELVRWKLPDGNPGEGIIYKPENFDHCKKYPVIFYYYERDADALNVFLNPELSDGVISIPWFVSNGYIVFVPDIHYKDGYPGNSALNTVVSAAHYLSGFSWADVSHMGLQGHSFGGFETNYIVSHTHLFVAAATGAGISNVISAYNRLDGTSRGQWFYETWQGRIGATLWNRPELYIQNSSIFRANKVTTPLLIMHNRNDRAVYFSQGSEWYSALSRLGKKVWMLSYEGEGHTIDQEKNQLDYSIRLGQFFDYYLKGATPPVWMTRGRQEWLKNKESGLEPDTTGAKP